MPLVSEVVIRDSASAVLERVENALNRVTNAEGRMQDGSVRSTRSLETVARQFEQIKRKGDPAYDTMVRLADQQTKLNRAVSLGVASQAEANAVMGKFHQQLPQTTQHMIGATQQSRAMSFAMTNLSFQVNDVVSGLAMGQRPLQIFTQQAGQFVQLFQRGGGFGAVMRETGATIRGFITPTTAAVAGVAALAGGIGVLLARASDATGSIRAFDVTLRGMGTSALANATDLEAAAKRLRNVGLSAAEARAQILSVARAGLNPNAAEQIIRTGTDIGAVRGGNGVETLTSALSGGLGSTVKLGLDLKALTVEEAAAFREMARLGAGAKALDQAFQNISDRLKGLHEAGLSPSARAMRDLGVAWNNMLDAFANSGPITLLVGKLTDLANTLERLMRGDLGSLSRLVTGAVGLLPGGGAVAGLADAARQAASSPREFTAALPPPSAAGLAPDLQVALRDMIASAAEQGITLGIGSGLRTTQRQAELYAADVARNGGRASGMVAPPGRSMHERGAAADLVDAQGRKIQAGSAEAQWLAQNASRYGLTRPMSFEPWHVEQAGARAGISTGDNRGAIDAALKMAEAQKLQADATAGVGLANEILKAKLEASRIAEEQLLDATTKARVEADLIAAAKTRVANEINNAATAAANEVTGQRNVADAYLQGSKAGLVMESALKAATEAHRIFGEVSSDAAKQYAADRLKEITALETQSERIRNNRDLLRERENQEVLEKQVSLSGQLPEIAQREVTLLQAKQEINREFPLLTEQEKQNRLAMVSATADLNVKLAETQRAQQQIDGIFRSIGDTIASSIGNVIDGIFDKKKVIDWGQAAKGIFNQLAQSLVIRPLTGELLSAFGASPNVVSQYGTFGGSGGGGLGLGTLLQGGGLLKDLFGIKLGGEGGLFGGVTNWLNNSIGPSLGFQGTEVLGFAGSDIGAVPTFGGPGLFGSTTFSQFLGGAGLGFGAGSLLNSLVGGNSTFGTIGSGIGSLAGAAIGSIIPGIGTLIGGLIGGAGGGLFGGLFGNNKPRNASAGGNIDFATGRVFDMFSGGNPQIDQATAQVIQQLGGFTQRLLQLSGGRLSGEVLLQNGVNTGFTADSSLPGYEGRFNLGRDPAEAVRTVSLALARSLADVSGTMRTVIDQVSDPAKLEAALQFASSYEKIDEAFKGAFANLPNQQQIGPFAQAMEQVRTIFADMTVKAGEFGLALEPVTAGLAEAERRLRGDFATLLNTSLIEATGGGAVNQLHALVASRYANLSEAAAIGLGSDTGTTESITRLFEAQVNAVLSGLDAAQLDQVRQNFTGLNDAIVTLSQSVVLAAASMQPLIDLRTELTSGSLSGLTPANAAIAANDNFNNLLAMVRAGDSSQIGALSAAGQSALQYSIDAYGNAPQTAALRTEILAALNLLLSGSFASGTPSTPPGLILVGERGPELMMQPGGSRIWSNQETERMLAAMPTFPSGRAFADGTGSWSDPEIKALLNKVVALLEGNIKIAQGVGVETVKRLDAVRVAVEKPAAVDVPPQRTKFA